jgi:hypothetical protein
VLNWLVDFFLRTGNGHHQRAYLKRLWDALEEKLNNAAYDPILDELAAFLAPEEEDDYQFWGRYPTNVPGFPERMYGANGLPGNIDLVKDQVRCHGTFLRDYILSSYPEIPALPRLKFTEIMYQPELGNQDLEFLEIVNFSGRPVDLSLWTIEDGIHYVFPPGSIVADGEVFVVARNPQRFRNRYRGVSNRVFGPYEGKLADEGDRVCLRDAGPGHPATIDFVGYNNKGVWPELLPGQSLELTAVGPSRDNDRGQNWMASSAGGGTPGTTAALFRRADVNDDQILNLTDALFILNYLFLSGPTPSCMDAADTNDDGLHNLTDGVFLLTHLFLNGPPPPPPHPAAGPDPTPDPFGCLR